MAIYEHEPLSLIQTLPRIVIVYIYETARRAGPQIRAQRRCMYQLMMVCEVT